MLDRNGSARANFLYAQLKLAKTYCLLAERSGSALLPNYLKNARRVYENVRRFMLRADLRPGELGDITSDGEQLRLRLEALEAQCKARVTCSHLML